MTDVDAMITIRKLLASKVKPSKATPLDLLQIIRMLAQQGDECDIYPSQGMLALELCTSVGAIGRSQKRLERFGWLTIKSGGKKRRTNFYAVHADQLPTDDLQRVISSPTARHLAAEYAKVQFRLLDKKRIPAGSVDRYSITMERLLKLCMGDGQRVADICNFSFNSRRYKKKALRSPFELFKCWAKVEADYDLQPLQPEATAATLIEPEPLRAESNAPSAPMPALPATVQLDPITAALLLEYSGEPAEAPQPDDPFGFGFPVERIVVETWAAVDREPD